MEDWSCACVSSVVKLCTTSAALPEGIGAGFEGILSVAVSLGISATGFDTGVKIGPFVGVGFSAGGDQIV